MLRDRAYDVPPGYSGRWSLLVRCVDELDATIAERDVLRAEAERLMLGRKRIANLLKRAGMTIADGQPSSPLAGECMYVAAELTEEPNE